MKRKLIILIGVLLVVCSPLLVAIMVSLSMFNWIQTDNDWIGFWGGYLGGLCTLIGVLITLRFSKEDSYEKQRMSVIPYISVSNNISHEKINEIPIGLEYFACESIDNKYYLFFEKVGVYGECKNIGLGPAVNCKIRDIMIGERVINPNTSKKSEIIMNGNMSFFFNINNLGIKEKYLSQKFINDYTDFWTPHNEETQPPEIKIQFLFDFEDILGNKYIQKVTYRGQLSKPISEKADSLYFLFESIEKPKLIN